MGTKSETLWTANKWTTSELHTQLPFHYFKFEKVYLKLVLNSFYSLESLDLGGFCLNLSMIIGINHQAQQAFHFKAKFEAINLHV